MDILNDDIDDNDIGVTEEEILQWLVDDKDGVIAGLRRGEPGEEAQRMARWSENMDDPKTKPVQERLNTLGEQLKTRREQLRLNSQQVGDKIGLDAATVRYLEAGWTDSRELAQVIKQWANTLQLDGEAYLNAVPGPASQRSLF